MGAGGRGDVGLDLGGGALGTRFDAVVGEVAGVGGGDEDVEGRGGGEGAEGGGEVGHVGGVAP